MKVLITKDRHCLSVLMMPPTESTSDHRAIHLKNHYILAAKEKHPLLPSIIGSGTEIYKKEPHIL